MTVIMRPIEVKCHSFIIAIAEPPFIDNEPSKRNIGFLLVCNNVCFPGGYSGFQVTGMIEGLFWVFWVRKFDKYFLG